MTFGPASSGVVSSDSDVTFGPAVSNWGSVPYVALHSAQTGGIVLAYQTFFDTSSNVVSVKAGDTLTFTAGNLKFSIS